ncbi:MAG: hypothetical protein CM15mP58_15920 [Burkholderiaceae bacterium]|nr:MAG: hypothetical protein CM15mP58_15920 [Burkholderiaceae bacterium]
MSLRNLLFYGAWWNEVIHVNYKSAKVDQIYFPQIEVIGHIMLSLDRLVN